MCPVRLSIKSVIFYANGDEPFLFACINCTDALFIPEKCGIFSSISVRIVIFPKYHKSRHEHFSLFFKVNISDGPYVEYILPINRSFVEQFFFRYSVLFSCYQRTFETKKAFVLKNICTKTEKLDQKFCVQSVLTESHQDQAYSAFARDICISFILTCFNNIDTYVIFFTQNRNTSAVEMVQLYLHGI